MSKKLLRTCLVARSGFRRFMVAHDRPQNDEHEREDHHAVIMSEKCLGQSEDDVTDAQQHAGNRIGLSAGGGTAEMQCKKTEWDQVQHQHGEQSRNSSFYQRVEVLVVQMAV